ncbi:MAG TPA: transposase [Bryobacteraceae bacterium]
MKSLEGDYRLQHLITLRFSRNLYQHYQTLLELLDQQMEASMSQLPDQGDLKDHPLPASQKKTPPKKRHNAPAYDLRTQCYRALGVDLTAIDGIDEVTAHVVLTEAGADFSSFPTAAHFCSWLRLCPNNETSGGRTLSRKTKKGKNRLALALRHGASTLHASDTPLGQYLRRMKARFGPARAITVTAHKIARIIYHMITQKEAFQPAMLDAQHARHKRKHEASVRKQALSLGFQLTPIVQPSA